MSVVASSPSSIGITSARFAQHIAQRPSLPKWWLDTKQAAWNHFNALALPTRADERWRFSNIKGVNIEAVELAEPFAGSSPPPALPSLAHTAEIAFSNNHLAHRTALPSELLAQGVIFCPLEEAVNRHSELLRSYFRKQLAALGSDKFVALNNAFASSGVLLFVPKGVEISTPFVIEHSVNGANKGIFPHTLIVLEDEAKATLVEFFVSADSGTHFASGVNDLHAGPGAQLKYVSAQNFSLDTLGFQHNNIFAQRDAEVLALSVHLGGRQTRHESHSLLVGSNAHSEMLALTVASNTQEFDQRTLQTHRAPNTSSNLLYKNALLDSARTIFSGLIVVEPEAQKTDAYQSNRNLMLSDEAEANSLPGLEIQANDVRCTHGATTARISPEQEFYLRSRGIDSARAQELLMFGFFEEVLEKLENEEIASGLRLLIQKKLKA